MFNPHEDGERDSEAGGARNMKLEELQAFIMLRGSSLTAEDKKRVIVDSGGETGRETSGVLTIQKERPHPKGL